MVSSIPAVFCCRLSSLSPPPPPSDASHTRFGTLAQAGRSLNYGGGRDHLIANYPTWIAKYRTLIYNGDFDGCVPYLANQGWTYHVAAQMGWV